MKTVKEKEKEGGINNGVGRVREKQVRIKGGEVYGNGGCMVDREGRQEGKGRKGETVKGWWEGKGRDWGRKVNLWRVEE